MRALHHAADSVLDFIETHHVGSRLFRIARALFFAFVILVGSRMAAAQFLGFTFDDLFFMATTAVVFMVVFWRWEIGLILVLASTSFIMYYHVLPTISLYHFVPEIKILEHLRLQVGQGLMLFLLAVFLTSREVTTARRRLATPLTPAVLVFMLALLVTAIVGVVFQGVHLRMMVETARPYSFYLMFFVVLLCLRGRREMSILLGALYVMAIIVAILMFVQFALGDRVKVFIGGGIRVHSFGDYAGRILPPGVELIWFTVPFVIARTPLESGRRQRLMVISLGILLGGILLTFTRTVWMAVLLSMGVMTVLGSKEIRKGIGRMVLAMAGSVGILLMVLSLLSTEHADYVAPYINRFTSIFRPESYESGTTAHARFEEIEAAWPNIVEHPWLGIGIGGIYRWEEAWDDIGKQHFLRGVSYIHNAYVLILTQAGILGLTSCLAMFGIFFYRARKILDLMRTPGDRALVIASIGAVASVLLASMMQPSLWYAPAVPLIGTVFGLVEALRYFREQEERDADFEAAIRRVRGRRRGPVRPAEPAPASGAVLQRRHRAMGSAGGFSRRPWTSRLR